jgi:tetratricopeptide (TPR) repeat protein
MASLGVLLYKRGDIDEAEPWYRRAAEAGNTYAMTNLGILLNERGDTDEAEVWYRRASEVGHVTAMYGLGILLKNRGDLDEAEAWHRRATEAGSTDSMFSLGVLFYEKGNLDEAEAWYRRAAEAGHIWAMDNLGQLLKNRGNLDEAEVWYSRAAEGGSAFATEGLAELRRKVDYSDRKLDSIKFDTFGWEMSQNDDGLRVWRNNDAALVERFFDCPPDFESWDAEEIREVVTESFDLVQSPTFRKEDLPEPVRKLMPSEFPEQASVFEVELFEIGPAKCLLTMTRQRVYDDVHYVSILTILFAECFWGCPAPQKLVHFVCQCQRKCEDQ